MKKILVFLLGIFVLFGVTGCSFGNDGYIPNGKYTLDEDGVEDYIKIDGTGVELHEGATILAFGEYSEEDGIITITYTFRNEIDEASDEYGNVIPYDRVDIAHLDGNSIVIDSSKVDGVSQDSSSVYTK